MIADRVPRVGRSEIELVSAYLRIARVAWATRSLKRFPLLRSAAPLRVTERLPQQRFGAEQD